MATDRIGHAVGGAIVTEGVATITNSTFDRNEALGGSNNTGHGGDLIVGRGAGRRDRQLHLLLQEFQPGGPDRR